MDNSSKRIDLDEGQQSKRFKRDFDQLSSNNGDAYKSIVINELKRNGRFKYFPGYDTNVSKLIDTNLKCS